ncbi:MAG: hypothetical protein PHS62_03760 [Patescibacteria group bacterium]|nr:hypothetical protein [Patescibacteria group bacterium]
MIYPLDINLEKLENVSKITLEDLSNPDILDRLKMIAVETDIRGSLNQAYYLSQELIKLLSNNKDFAQIDPELFKAYQRLIVYLKFLCLISQPLNDIEDLFKKHLLLAIREEIELKVRLKLIFLINSDEETGDKIRLAIIKALEANEEKIGKENLAGSVDGLPIYPYIKNWLRNYISFFSAEKEERGELEQVTYLGQNQNVKQLSQGEKEILTEVIKLYDYLCFPQEERGEVKATGHIATMIPGRPRTGETKQVGDITKPAAVVKQAKSAGAGGINKNLDELKKLAAKYPSGSLERKVVEEEIERQKSGIRNKV